MNNKNISFFLLLPFIVSPFLITGRFLDPTLIFKKSAVFFLFTLAMLLFIFMKKKINSLFDSQGVWIVGLFVFIIYVLITSLLKSVNMTESLWGIIYFTGWFCISIIFLLYSNYITIKKIFFLTSIIGGTLSFLAILQSNIPYFVQLNLI